MRKKAKVDVVEIEWENDRYAHSLDEEYYVERECPTDLIDLAKSQLP